MRLLRYVLYSFLGVWVLLVSCKQKVITMELLLEEMVSVEEAARFPDPAYICCQESSHDRRSVSPNDPYWFANDDGFGIIRVDTVGKRLEKVMFDEKGPGVITRIWITTIDKRGTWRFYFDGASEPGWSIPSYDLMQIGVPGISRGLLQPHTSYTPDGKGGNTLFLPIPYAKGCKITFEDAPGVNSTPKYYGINYRKYPENTKIETFSPEVVKRAEKKIAEVDDRLLRPGLSQEGVTISGNKQLKTSDSLNLILPKGENAVYEVKFHIEVKDSTYFAQAMREIVFCACFDDKQTVWVPLSDFSGGGMGAPRVESWYLSSDGKGNVTSRWLMPYQKQGRLSLVNFSDWAIEAELEAVVSDLPWDERSLYFHSSWRQEMGIYVHDRPDERDNCIEWNFATLEGRGIYKGDLLSLFNHTPLWYGEGDEKIWVDADTFPSHFGTGTEDYYNSSWAPVVPFYTPFGGALRADMESSRGYNAFLRTRNLDNIPFGQKFKFDIEMLGWQRGYVDYATTVYWYGDKEAHAIGVSGVDEVRKKLMPVPENPKDYKIANSIEFETLTISGQSSALHLREQGMVSFTGGRWSRASQLLAPDGKPGDYVEFDFEGLAYSKYKLILYATQANDYGVITFKVNNHSTKIHFDGYAKEVKPSQPIELGTFESVSGVIKLKIEIVGTNKQTQGARYMFGLDCIQLIPTE